MARYQLHGKHILSPVNKKGVPAVYPPLLPDVWRQSVSKEICFSTSAARKKKSSSRQPPRLIFDRGNPIQTAGARKHQITPLTPSPPYSNRGLCVWNALRCLNSTTTQWPEQLALSLGVAEATPETSKPLLPAGRILQPVVDSAGC